MASETDTIPVPENGNTTFSSDDWMHYDGPNNVILGEGWTAIEDEALYKNQSLVSVQIPASVRVIGNSAFYGASRLVRVAFNKNSKLETIEPGAFRDTKSLKTFQFPANVKEIRQDAFNGTSLETVRIPKMVTKIGDKAFANTVALKEIIFEQNSKIAHIGRNAFSGSGLTLVVIGESALERLNVERHTLNMPPLRFGEVPPLQFGENNSFYGKDNVTIVSMTDSINTFALGVTKPGYKKRTLIKKILRIPKKQTRPSLPKDVTNLVGEFLTGITPKSRHVLTKRATSPSKGGARNQKTRKRR
jgi:hypothetical protein